MQKMRSCLGREKDSEMTEQERFYEEWFYIVEGLRGVLEGLMSDAKTEIKIADEDIKNALGNKFVHWEIVKQIEGLRKHKSEKHVL